MANVPATNINLSEDIGVAVDRTAYIETSLTTAATGGYEAINTDSPMHPNGTAQHSMAEWINYDHDYVANDPPNAIITGQTTGTTGTQINLSGTSSTDDNGITGWAWSNNVNAQTSTSSSYSFNISTAQTVTVTLVVTDAASLTDTDTHSVVVSAPVVNSVSLRKDSTFFGACYFAGSVTVYFSGASYAHGSTFIYTSSSLSTFAASDLYGDGSNAIQWNAPGWGMPSSC